MAKRTDWEVNVEKLRVCFTMPENLYSYLNEHRKTLLIFAETY